MKTDLTPNITVYDETGDRKFLFSVIIPVYNTCDYVGEAIESIIGQTVGFSANIQLVLVNDGSTDESGAICAAYQKRFPGNIVYVDKTNEGVSVARNVALSLCRGDFVNCLDSDDYWSSDAFLCAAHFFLDHPDLNIVAARHEFFGRDCAPHALSYKFNVDKVVDITKRFDYPQLSLSNAFVRRELIPEAPFDPALKISEDFSIMGGILLDELRYGIMAAPTYYYRKRDEATSAIDTALGNLSWYFDTPEHCYRRLMELSRVKFGRVIPYIQYCVMYDLQWRLRQKAGCPLDDSQMAQYRALIVSLLRDIDDDVILMQRNLFRDDKLLALSLKYGVPTSEIQKQLAVDGNHVVWKKQLKQQTQQRQQKQQAEQAEQAQQKQQRQHNGMHSFSLLPFYGIDFECNVMLEFCKAIEDDSSSIAGAGGSCSGSMQNAPASQSEKSPSGSFICLSGQLSVMLAREHVRMVAVCAGREFECTLLPDFEQAKSSIFGRMHYIPSRFEVCIPTGFIRQSANSSQPESRPFPIDFYLDFPTIRRRASLEFGKFFPVRDIAGSYAVLGDCILSAAMRAGNWQLAIEPFSATAESRHERALFAGALIGRKDIVKYLALRPAARKAHKAMPAFRFSQNRRVWLLSDRPNLAGDNGEALFEYLQEHPIEGVDTYFVLQHTSPDFERLQRIGKVVRYGSREHFALTLRAEVIASSSGDDIAFNPFGPGSKVLSGLMHAKFVFLQHGITKDDLSDWIHKSNKNIALFVTAAPREKASIVENPCYGYGEAEVLCSGFPRHDKLLAAAARYEQLLAREMHEEPDAQGMQGAHGAREGKEVRETKGAREVKELRDAREVRDVQEVRDAQDVRDVQEAPKGNAALRASARRRLIIAPTWRNYLARPVDQHTGVRPENPNFEKSDYFHFYNGLLNDSRLCAAARENNFEIRYLMHPSFIQELHKFHSDECVIVTEYNYAEEMAFASVMLTDYSSVAFDFALLKRPVAYAQTDPSTFFSGHTYNQGYFSYADDGFGPICATYDETVDQLIAFMRNPVMAPEYRARVDDFFFWPAEPRCKIVADAIASLV